MQRRPSPLEQLLIMPDRPWLASERGRGLLVAPASIVYIATLVNKQDARRIQFTWHFSVATAGETLSAR